MDRSKQPICVAPGCKKHIPWARLEAQPRARTCSRECASKNSRYRASLRQQAYRARQRDASIPPAPQE